MCVTTGILSRVGGPDRATDLEQRYKHVSLVIQQMACGGSKRVAEMRSQMSEWMWSRVLPTLGKIPGQPQKRQWRGTA